MINFLSRYAGRFFRRFGYSTFDGGYGFTLFAKWYSPTPTSFALWGIWANWFQGWEPYPNFDQFVERLVVTVFGHRYQIYEFILAWEEHDEFPQGEFPNYRHLYYGEGAPEDDFFVRGVDHQAYPDCEHQYEPTDTQGHEMECVVCGTLWRTD